MGWFKNMIMKVLKIQPARDRDIVIKEPLTFAANVMKNRIWYRGDPSELDQFFRKSAVDDVTKSRFWAAVPSQGYIRKFHSGIPSIIAERLSDIVIADIDSISVNGHKAKEGDTGIWEEIAKDNNFTDILSEAIIETLVTGDGAFKISINTDVSGVPIIEYFSGENVEYLKENGRLKEVWFYTVYGVEPSIYKLKSIYGKGYIRYELYQESGKQVELSAIPETARLQDIEYDSDFIMAVPMMYFKSPKFKGRGRSIFDGKSDSFDALDETLSQWVDAIRDGRVNKYIPTDLIPRNENTGELLIPNSFDNKFIKIQSGMSENGEGNKIEVVQPLINYEAYVNTYSSNLDMCLQGIISPATLGIDLKKTDNALAQREKEKVTLYTRGKIIDSLTEVVPELIEIVLQVNDLLYGRRVKEYEAMVEFGEYGSPTFEQTVETIGKASQYELMSIETKVDALWGDRKDDNWKKKEVKRLKAEQGIADVEEPGVNMAAGDFVVNGGVTDEGKGGKPNIQNEPAGVPGASEGSK